ncbi:MAG TPA: uroporphyrinogen-III C-methyltransferase [Burkholderiales bacterium]|jgi:uroporphyrin-3 C-methyltransferase|nr:uroporphyrinogen-III C-methyltransferase [Burkholderiales bacterium]
MAEPSTEQQTVADTRAAAQPQRRSRLAVMALLLALAATALAGWQWYDARKRFDVLQQDVARRLSEADALGRDTRSLAGQSRDELRDVVARLGQLEARLVETQNQRLALESLYRDLSGSRDEWVLAEVEQALLIANQQLQLAGNVKAALIALETADARLARMDRPQLTALRRVISQDIERLKAAPYVDVVGMALRLDNVMTAVDTLPLAMEERPHYPASDAAAPASGGFWANLWHETMQDLRRLVRIQDAEKPEAPLLSPEQAFFLRENLKLRLLGARLALLTRDETSFKADLGAASDWLQRFYDTGSKPVAAALSTVKQLAQSEVNIELPDISASLDAARNLRTVRERTAR